MHAQFDTDMPFAPWKPEINEHNYGICTDNWLHLKSILSILKEVTFFVTK